MKINENTYDYMRKASSQIEGITCVLAAYIENAGDEIRTYHYKVYNDFINEIRRQQIAAITKIRDVFYNTRTSIEAVSYKLLSSDASIKLLTNELNDFESKIGFLVIHCENIRECQSDTENPYIPNADDDIYRALSGYRKLIDDYPLHEPEDQEDIICSIIYSFYTESTAIYDNLFSEYDTMFSEMGIELEQRRKAIVQKQDEETLQRVKKRTGIKKIGKDVASLGLVATAAAFGIKNKNVFDVVSKGIGLCATVSEQLEEISPNKKSAARNVLKKIKTFNNTMSLAEETMGILNPSSEVTSAAKLTLATLMMRDGAENIAQLDESGKMDMIVSTAGLIGSIVGVASAKGVINKLRNIPKVANNAIGFVEYYAKYCDKNEIHIRSKWADDKLHKLALDIEKYNTSVKEYKAKVLRQIPAKKPKAPPGMWVHKGVKIAVSVNDYIEKYGGNTSDFIKKIL